MWLNVWFGFFNDELIALRSAVYRHLNILSCGLRKTGKACLAVPLRVELPCHRLKQRVYGSPMPGMNPALRNDVVHRQTDDIHIDNL